MSETIPAPHYTLDEAISVCLAACERAMMEVRALARMPGPAGPPGAPGIDGKDGARGPKGETGRNASDLSALQEYVNEQIERTLKIAKMTTPDGGRTLLWQFGDTVHEIRTALVLDAGVWKDGATYVPGDAVTVGGSLFIAQAETKSMPGQSADWRLAVKRGLDAKEHRSTEERTVKPIRFK